MFEKAAVDKVFAENNVVIVKFTKKDGSIRDMTCTTKLDLVPAVSHPKGAGTPNPETKPVWDMQKQAWRSFRYDSLLEVTPVTK